MTWQVALITSGFGLLTVVVTAIVAPLLLARLVDRRLAPSTAKLDAMHETLMQNSNTDSPVTMRDEIHWLMKHAEKVDTRLKDGDGNLSDIRAQVGLPPWPSDPAA